MNKLSQVELLKVETGVLGASESEGNFSLQRVKVLMSQHGVYYSVSDEIMKKVDDCLLESLIDTHKC